MTTATTSRDHALTDDKYQASVSRRISLIRLTPVP